MNGQIPADALRVIEEAAAQAAVEIYHVESSGRTLRVQIDSAEGVSLDACTSFSRALASALDRSDAIPARYFLEVSSPGVERHLYRPAHYARVLGRDLSVRTHAGALQGRLVRADARSLTLLVSDREEQVETIVGYDEIRSARVRVPDTELFSRHKETETTR